MPATIRTPSRTYASGPVAPSNPDTSDVVELRAGDAANIPALAFHHAWNVGDETCEILWWVPGEMHTDEFKQTISTKEHGEWQWYGRSAVMLNGTHHRNEGFPSHLDDLATWPQATSTKGPVDMQHQPASRWLRLLQGTDPRLTVLVSFFYCDDRIRCGKVTLPAGRELEPAVGPLGEDALGRGRIALGQPHRDAPEPARPAGRGRVPAARDRAQPPGDRRRARDRAVRRGALMEHRLGQLTRVEAGDRARAGAICLVPVGALEQHGDHLPLSTDSLIAEHVCLEVARRARSDVLVTPPLWTGVSPHHLRFGATVTIAAATFAALVRGTVESLHTWCSRVVVVNGHGGNRGPLITLGVESGIESISYWEVVRTPRMTALFPFDLGSVGHAGEFETSVMLEAFPALVGEPGFGHESIVEQNDAFLVPEMGESGVLGDPRAATAEGGRAVLEDVVVALIAVLDGPDGDNDLDNDGDVVETTEEIE